MTQTKIPVLVLVGGFLGAGKTTLILRAARLLRERGLRVAAIMNDQDEGLVDSMYSEAQDVDTQEVAGGCFCCRFQDLIAAAGRLREHDPDVIFAEPVGSCIDLSATILAPVKEMYRDQFRLAPLTVVVDPEMASRVELGEASRDAGYLFRNQLAEADVVVLNKSDLPAKPLDWNVDYRLSARTGDGIEEWLSDVLSGRRQAGARKLQVNYGRYAEAEAALGWLNLRASLTLRLAIAPAMLVGPLLDGIDAALTEAGIAIAHLKVFDLCAAGYVKASVTSNGAEPHVEGDLLAGAASEHDLVVNLRAEGDPAALREIVERQLGHLDGGLEMKHLGAFRPPAPVPPKNL